LSHQTKQYLQDRLANLTKFIENNYEFLSLALLFFCLRLPSLLAHEIVNDEGIYAAIAKQMTLGKTLYVTIWDHKPPLLFGLYYVAGVLSQFNHLYFWVRLIAIAGGIYSINLMRKIVMELKFPERLRYYVLLVFTVLLGAPIYLNYEANAEVFIVLFVLILLYSLLKRKSFYLLGGLLFLGLCLKVQGFIELAGIAGIFIFFYDSSAIKQKAISVIQLILGFSIPFGISAIILNKYGLFSYYVDTILFSNLTYTGLINPTVNLVRTIFPIRYIVYIAFTFIVTIYSYMSITKKISRIDALCIGIFIIEAFCVVFPLRSYAHYFIQLLPGITLLIAVSISNYIASNKKMLTYSTIAIIFVHLFFFSDLFFFHVTRHDAIDLQWLSELTSIEYSNKISAFSVRTNKEYAGKKVFLYTSQPWNFVYLTTPTVNKYVFTQHYWIDLNTQKEALEEIRNADIAIFDDYSVKDKEMLLLLKDSLTYQYSLNGYNYYSVNSK